MQLVGQRTDQDHTRNADQFAHLLQGHFGLAAGHRFGAGAALNEHGLRIDDIGDTELL